MIHPILKLNPIIIFLINVLAYVVAYYVSLLLHEWGHGTVAWLYGVKSSPFNIQYGGLFLMHADEHVPYANLIQTGRGFSAAMIGIAGLTASVFLLIVSFILMNLNYCIQHSKIFIFAYWFFIINMIPALQYFAVSPFSSEGDAGRFVHGLNISPLWVFLPGITFVILALLRLLRVEILKAYAVMPINSILGRNILLLLTLSTLFLFIYMHDYNPLFNKGSSAIVKILAFISIIAAPVLFITCAVKPCPSGRGCKAHIF